MEVITAPTFPTEVDNSISVFLAGGITKCRNWQEDVIDYIEGNEFTTKKKIDLRIYNPRRSIFNILDKDASKAQIEWEYRMIEKADIFSMYFCNSESDQPICMYELGMRLGRLMERPYDPEYGYRTIISVERGYKRAEEVIIQTSLASENMIKVHLNADPYSHSELIVKEYHRIKEYYNRHHMKIYTEE